MTWGQRWTFNKCFSESGTVHLPSVRFDRDSNTLSTSSERFYVDLTAGSAWSYSWWQMMAFNRKKNILVRNTCGYSMQTGMHQDVLDRILELEAPTLKDTKIVKVWVKEGLQNLEGAIRNAHFDGLLRNFDNSKRIKELQNVQKLLGKRLTRLSGTERKELKAKAMASQEAERARRRFKAQTLKHQKLNKEGFFTKAQWNALSFKRNPWEISNIDSPNYQAPQC